MTNEKKQEIIAAMTGLLEHLTDSEPPKTEPSHAPEQVVEMLTIRECTEAVRGSQRSERIHRKAACSAQRTTLHQNGSGKARKDTCAESSTYGIFYGR